MASKIENSQALVMGGGGVTGIAWMTGVVLALSEAGIDLGNAGLFVGTSAGSVVATQLATGVPVDKLFATQLEPATGEIAANFSADEFQNTIMQVINEVGYASQAIRQAVGKLALAKETVPEEARVEVMRKRLPIHEWPDRPLLITAVDTANGEWTAFDRNSGVDLVHAVAASCAVPLVWPPVTINGRRYMDGGIRSGTNADLAKGFSKVLILAPMVEPADMPPIFGSNTRVEKQLLENEGSQVLVINPDQATLDIVGTNGLDPAIRAPAARSGYAQGKTLVELVRGFWN